MRSNLTFLALPLLFAFIGCSGGGPPAPGSPAATPNPKPVSGGSQNAVSVTNGVMRVELKFIEGSPVLQIARENIPVYEDNGAVNSAALVQWIKAGQDINGDLPPARRLELETVEINVGTQVPQDAVKDCAAVIRELGIEVLIDRQESPE